MPLYTTIVDNDERELQSIMDAARRFVSEDSLRQVDNCDITKEQVLGITEFVKQYQAILQREFEALSELSKTFNRRYATNNNDCFTKAASLFGQIRSTITAAKRAYKNFRRYVRDSRDDAPTGQTRRACRPKEMRRRMREDYKSGQVHGTETYDECVAGLYRQLKEFYFLLVSCICLCNEVMKEERNIRLSPERCMKLYREYYREMLESTQLVIRHYKIANYQPTSEFGMGRGQSRSEEEFVCRGFHAVDEGGFQIHVIHSEMTKEDKMTDVEKALFGDGGKEMARKARLVAGHFDELEEGAHKGRHHARHSAQCVASFMLWCGIGKGQDGKVRAFVEEFFNKVYKGGYPPVKTNSVNTAKNTLLHEPWKSSLDNGKFHARIDEMVERLSSGEGGKPMEAVDF